MKDCIFCQIAIGKSPSYKIYEDENFYGFLDIFPTTKGHSMLIPKKHFRWVHDVPNFGLYWETVLKVERAIEKSLEPKWVQYMTHGLISHAHIHILPRYDEVDAGFVPKHKIEKPTDQEMNEISAKIRESLDLTKLK
jgi:histidine triad (HIT) family protein